MKQKEKYTLAELYDNLRIPYSELSRMARVNEGTLTRIRKGYAARRSTINKLLDAFSETYGIDLSIDNVIGINLEEKQDDEDKQPKVRTRSRKRDSIDYELPPGCILAHTFARLHNVAPMTFRDHILIGLGRGEKEKAQVTERPKPGRPSETERYLTQEQQAAVLDFWRRHGVEFTMPEAENNLHEERTAL